jgi:phosphoadenosine phosphosulfate reductase
MAASRDRAPWTDDRLAAMNDRFESSSARDVLCWGLDTFAPGIVQATGFGPSGIVIMHLLAELRPDTTVFYVDTGVLFPETYALRDELAARLPLQIEAVQSDTSLAEQEATHGPALWNRDPNRCCGIRKVRPFRRYLASKRAWIAGLRRDQSPERADTPIVTWDARHELVKLNPLAPWTRGAVWRYIYDHDLPYNPLHDAGYPSLGCTHCTQPAHTSQDKRAGRWSGFQKTECGLHR